MNAPVAAGPMFELKAKAGKLRAVNPRAELHGEDPKPACDLMLSVDLPASALSQFDPDLPSALFKPDADKPQLVDGNLSAVRFPLLQTLKYKRECLGYSGQIDYGIDDSSAVKLGTVDVDHFRFECRNGGTVVCDFRVIVHPTADAMGKLCTMIGHEVTVTLTPPEAQPDTAGKKSEKKAQPAPADGQWPFPTGSRDESVKECFAVLSDRGYDVTIEFVRAMTPQELVECIAYAKALGDLSSTNAVPSTPTVLKGRYPKAK